MEFHLPDFLYCHICFEVYNRAEFIPLFIPCNKGHTICSSCVSKELKKNNVFRCPFDMIQIEFKTLEEFPVNHNILELLTDFCLEHSKKKDLICIPCQVKLCSGCKGTTVHQSHNPIPIEQYHHEASKTVTSLKEVVKKVEDMQDLIRDNEILIESQQEKLCEMVELRYTQYVNEILKAKHRTQNQIREHFLSLRSSLDININGANNQNRHIFTWKDRVDKDLEHFESLEYSDLKLFESLKNEAITNYDDICHWINKKRKRIQEIEEEVENTFLEFNNKAGAQLYEFCELRKQKDIIKDVASSSMDISSDVIEEANNFQMEEEVQQKEEREIGENIIVSKLQDLQKLQNYSKSVGLEMIGSINMNLTVGQGHLQTNELDQAKLKFFNSRPIDDQTKIINLIQKISQLKSISHMDLELDSCPNLNDDSLTALSHSLSNLIKLNELHLSFPSCSNITSTAMAPLGQHIAKLVQLKKISFGFSKSKVFWENGVAALTSNLSQLRQLEAISLNMSGCLSFTDNALSNLSQNLFQLKGLKELHLNFSGCKKLTQDGLLKLSLGIPKLNSLESLYLNLAGWSQMSSDGVETLMGKVAKVSHLKRLSLDFSWWKKFNEKAMITLGNCLAKLTSLTQLELNLYDCASLTENSLVSLSQQIGTLTKILSLNLNLSWCYEVTDTGMYHIARNISKITGLNHLKCNFACCPSISGNGLTTFMRDIAKMPDLNNLELNFSWQSYKFLFNDYRSCSKLTDRALTTFSKELIQMRKLTVLDLNFSCCSGITDSGLEAFTQNLVTLNQLTKSHFSFLRCTGVTSAGYSALSQLEC